MILTLLLALPLLAADPTAEKYQQSYAFEAAYSYDRALAQIADIPAQGDDAYPLPLRRGWLLYLLGRYEESVSAYRAAIAADPQATEAHLGITLPLMALKRWSETQDECRAVLAAAPGNFLGQSRLAYALYNAGRHAEAEAIYRVLVQQYPADVDLRAGLGWALLKQGRRAPAAEQFDRVLHLVPDHASAKEGKAALE